MEFSTFLLTCLAILVVYWVMRYFTSRTPPGPTGLPLVGYLPFLSRNPHLDLMKLSKKYGPVFSIRMGSVYTIVIGDYENMKEAFGMDAFMGRPVEMPFEFSKESIETQAFTGLPWRDQRRFALHMLRDLGFGKSRMEDLMREEILELTEFMDKTEGKPTAMRFLLAPSMSNNISALMFGRRLPYDSAERKMLDRTISESSKAGAQVTWQLFFPWLRKTLRFLGIGDVDRMSRIDKDLRGFVRKEIDEHKRTLDENNIRDFIDAYLLEIKKSKDPAFVEPVLQDMVGAFFGGGSETVRVTMEWLLLLMADMPEVQKKVHAEIDEVLGRHRMPSYADHSNMPYCHAVITELMRWKTIIPINLLRYTLADSELNGYVIPKHTYIMNNIWQVHHDPEYWGSDAEYFRPERFLSDDGKAFVKSKYFVVFSIGKRSCPGEPMARVEVFLYFVSLLQKFHFSMPPGKKANFEGELSIGFQPKHAQEIIIRRRD